MTSVLTDPLILTDIEVVADRPPIVTVAGADDPLAWAVGNRAGVRASVAAHGALLVRGLRLADRDQASTTLAALADELVVEREAFAPREAYADGTYASTPWPANQQMCMHHELSYRLAFPGLMMFACVTAPEQGGATTVADGAQVLAALPADLLSRFEQDGWMLVRHYNDEIGASWEESFGTSDRTSVERYCRDNAIKATWTDDGGLRTWQRRSAVIRHPRTGERSWFNQVAFLSEWTIEEDVRDYLVDVYGEDGLPFTTAYGDGSPIEPEVVALINDTYTAHTVREPWQAGDLLLVDNVRTAHSREAYSGDRDVVVALADPVRLADCSPTVTAVPA